MSKMKKFLAVTLMLCMSMTMLVGCGKSEAPAPTTEEATKESFNIGILQLVEHGALDKATEGIKEGLKEAGFEEGKNITIDFQNAQGDQSNLQTISQRFVNNKSDLIFGVATPAAQALATATQESQIPVVVTAVTDLVGAKLVESNEAPGTNITGTSDLTPVADQLDLLVKIAPEAKTVGIIYTASEVNSEIQVEMAKAHAETLGLTVDVKTITSVNDMQQVAESMVGKVDAIYVPTDNMIASAMPNLGAIAEKAKVPVICGESAMVENGGLITIGLDYYNLGKQTGHMAAKILKGEATPQTMPVEFIQELTVCVNKTVADNIGVTIPQDILDSAQVIE